MNFKNFFKSAFAVKRELNTCHDVENVPASYQKKVITISKPLIQRPITRTVTQEIVTKEAATERYIECDPETGKVRICDRQIPQETTTVTYSIIEGYETVQAAEVLSIEVEEKVSDGGIVEVC